MSGRRPASGESWLFVPGHRPDRFDKAAAAGASQVILDLEDAVADADKPVAREAVAAWLRGGGVGWVRINGHGTTWHDDDLTALAGCPGLRGVVVPKAHDPAVLTGVAARIADDAGVLALIETAAGVRDVAALAATPAVSGLAFGSLDFALDIDAEETDAALAYARGALVVAARAAGHPGPVDGVTVETRDLDVVRRDASRARASGFGGKLCIHPAQVPAVRDAFTPDPGDVAWARKVTAAAPPSGAAFSLDGRMIDKPVLDRARRVLERSGS